MRCQYEAVEHEYMVERHFCNYNDWRFFPQRRLVMPLINKTFLSCLISCKERNISTDIAGALFMSCCVLALHARMALNKTKPKQIVLLNML